MKTQINLLVIVNLIKPSIRPAKLRSRCHWTLFCRDIYPSNFARDMFDFEKVCRTMCTWEFCFMICKVGSCSCYVK
jgi:hypothetical protein